MAPGEPQAGHRFNPRKLLLDPYAKAITGSFKWGEEMFGYRIGGNEDFDMDASTTLKNSASPLLKSCPSSTL